MKNLRSNIKLYKELKELWYWLGFYIWVENWRKASEISNKIDELKEEHRIINFFAYTFHAWW